MWSLYEQEKELKPLVFSNGKSQEDIVREVLESIKQGYKIIFIKGMCGTGKCLDRETLIFCKPNDKKYFGYYKISDLVGKEGKITSLNKKGNLVESDFKNVRKTGRKKLYKLKTRTGREVIASKNHPLLTITKDGTGWQPLEELNSNSYICMPNKIGFNETIDFDDNKIKILAHLIAEGKLGDKTGSPRYYQCPKQNPQIRKDYEDALRALFPEGEIKSYFGNDVNIIFRKMDTRFGTTNKLRLFIRDQGLDRKTSNQKFVPKIIFNLKREKIALFLSRLFSCDGSIYVKKGRKNRSNQIIIEYSSISNLLIKDVSFLLLKFGIQHTIISKKFREDSNYAKRITISNQKSIREFIEEIGFVGKKQRLAEEIYKTTKIHKFTNIDKIPRVIRNYLKNKGYSYSQLDRFLNYEEIEKVRKNKGYKKIKKDKPVRTPCVFMQGKNDFLRSHLRKVNEHIQDPMISFINNNDVIWDKIKSIEYLKQDETYDLEVPGYSNFIADGIIVHNSAIALNLARQLGKTSIVVPVKSLQEQYIEDYSGKSGKHLIYNGKKLKISSIVGRQNFKCNYLNKISISSPTSEKNARLFDVFEGRPINEKDDSCNNNFLPCKIEIKEKNMQKIREYIRQNPDIKITNFSSINEVKRMSIAPICPYWSPILPEEFEIKKFENARKVYYSGLNNKKFTIYQRKPGCPYYDQYLAYADSDVIIFNSLKYQIETLMDRKPATEVEIIDECDEFLDSFANQEQINLNKLLFALNMVFPETKETQKIIEELIDTTNTIKRKYKESDEIFEIKNTIIKDLILTFLRNPELIDEIEVDESSYVYHLDRVARIFYDFLDETFFSIEKKENDLIIKLVTTNLEKRFKELIEKNKIIIMMSGTIHSESVLKNIFGLDKFKIIEAEIKSQGELIQCKHGYEVDCKYANFQSEKVSREEYLKIFSKTVDCAKKPTLVHLTSFSDLPTNYEKERFDINNLPSQVELQEEQRNDPFGKRITSFKNKKIPVLFTTKCNRGIDFPGEICNSIIISRFPYPNISSLFWKILKKTNPENFMSFYMDKARRELLQKVYRGLRSKNDRVYLLSPDVRVLNFQFKE